jgi:hypothetical protein
MPGGNLELRLGRGDAAFEGGAGSPAHLRAGVVQRLVERLEESGDLVLREARTEFALLSVLTAHQLDRARQRVRRLGRYGERAHHDEAKGCRSHPALRYRKSEQQDVASIPTVAKATKPQQIALLATGTHHRARAKQLDKWLASD